VVTIMKTPLLKASFNSSNEAARLDVFNYIEIFYNPMRRHGTSDNFSPVEYEGVTLRA